MKKKFRCMVCGYVHEGDNPPAECPVCRAKAEKFVEIKEEGLNWACEHKLGDGQVEDAEVLQGLHDHFTGECSEVGMYLAMSRQAEREGYPEIADAFKRYAFEEADRQEAHGGRVRRLRGQTCHRQARQTARLRRRPRLHPRDGQGRSPSRSRLPGPLQPLFQEIVSA